MGEREFIEGFMADPARISEYSDKKLRAVAAYRSWRQHHPEAHEIMARAALRSRWAASTGALWDRVIREVNRENGR